ncbi:MAG: transporter substrate-binding domain-containing protein [Rhodanobacter sp.]|nr:transporter substrate-binding domain-containing protein [Rhodanobacter sp.]
MKYTTPVMMFMVGALACAGWPSAVAAAPAGGALKVCADSGYLPYSDKDGKGFENDVARYVADKLGTKLEYIWGNTRGHGGFSEYLARNLDNGRCDLVIDMPYGNNEELTTDPYYASSYVFVFKKNKGHDLQSLDSPELHKLKVGYESETPIETGLQLRGMVQKAKSFDVGGKNGTSPRSVLDAVENGTVDVMITWQPSIGAFLKDYPDLTTVTVPNSRATGSPEMYTFPMSMAVRKNDQALKTRLDAVIKAHTPQLRAILKRHGVEMAGTAAGGSMNDSAGL